MKKIIDYSDADMERLLDQWNENVDDPDDDTPESRKYISKVLKVCMFMVFIIVANNPNRSVTDEVIKFHA